MITNNTSNISKDFSEQTQSNQTNQPPSIPSAVFESAHPSGMAETVVNSKREWTDLDHERLSLKFELLNFRVFLLDLQPQVAYLGYSILEPVQKQTFDFVSEELKDLISECRNVDQAAMKAFLFNKRKRLIEIISFLPNSINDLKLKMEQPPAFGLSDPNLLKVIFHASWIRKETGTAARNNIVDLNLKLPILSYSLMQICALGKEDDWKIVADLIPDEKLKMEVITKTIAKLIENNYPQKAKELIEAIKQ